MEFVNGYFAKRIWKFYEKVGGNMVEIMKVLKGNDFENLHNLVECFIMKLSYE